MLKRFFYFWAFDTSLGGNALLKIALMFDSRLKYLLFVPMLLCACWKTAPAQTAYFIDGYHGGVYGHYPRWQTRFMVEQLIKHPDWKINLEIEPETWDSVKVYDPEAYNRFKSALDNPAFRDRIEIVNPSYGQSYFFNTSGESIIRQFAYGIRKTKEHFPSLDFVTYSSEEPCFTSALPQILKSFGFKYASLKNPNTCWGGYVRAYGGEKVTWVGPDGSGIPTVPRYRVESLEEGSTWQTTAWRSSVDYIHACLKDSIAHPVGMCLQDAGWRGGPWLGSGENSYQPTVYTLWREYFESVSTEPASESWQLSQEDIQVSLMWGSQVLQRLAQQVRAAENKVVAAEKIASMHSFYERAPYPTSAFDDAWRTLLLSQHHDCWIVPYNGDPGDTWADKTKRWTDITHQISDSIITRSLPRTGGHRADHRGTFLQLFNTVEQARSEIVAIPLSVEADNNLGVRNRRGKWMTTQLIWNPEEGRHELLFLSDVPSLGYNTYRLEKQKSKRPNQSSSISEVGDNTYRIVTNFYEIELDASQGGVIRSMKAKKFGDKEFVQPGSERSFNELRGFFYEENAFISSKDNPATVEVLADGPLQVQIAINGYIHLHPFRQVITLYQHDPRIDFDLVIDWQGNPGIGKYSQAHNLKWEDPEKAFYNDRYKLLALFPLDLELHKVYKDAPFDVTESQLEDTYFNRWDSIKNNVVLNWVDVEDSTGDYGIALLTDHTTSYAFGKDNILGLNLQYSGAGLWGRNYKITGPSRVRYALLPHAGRWDESGLNVQTLRWNTPVFSVLTPDEPKVWERSWIEVRKEGWEVPAIQMVDGDCLLRLFNSAGDDSSGDVVIDGRVEKAELVELSGATREVLPVVTREGRSIISLSMPRFGIRTIKLTMK